MKNIALNNFDRVNMLVTIGGKVFTNDFFELTGITAFSRGSNSSTTGVLKVLGDIELFSAINNSATAIVQLDTDAGVIDYLTLYVKRPVVYDGEYITVELDTLPRKRYLGYTTPWGVKLPYSFGDPWVHLANVSQRLTGVALETQQCLTFQDINQILNAYVETINSLTACSIFGTSKDIGQELHSVGNFYNLITQYTVQVPFQASVLDNFLDLLYWRGSSSGYLGGDADGGSVYYSNVGFLPPINLHSVLNSTADTNTIDYYYANDYFEQSINSPGGMHLYTHVITNETLDLYTLQSRILDWADQLTTLPSTLKVDFGRYSGPMILSVNGLIVEGNYNNYSLTITSRGTELTNASINAASDNHSVIVSGSLSGRLLIGKFLHIVSNAPPTSYRAFSFNYVAQVIAQNGDVITLNVLPFVDYAQYTNSENFVAPYSGGITSTCGLLREGDVLGIADSLEALFFGQTEQLIQTLATWNSTQMFEAPFYTLTKVNSDMAAEAQTLYGEVYSTYQEILSGLQNDVATARAELNSSPSDYSLQQALVDAEKALFDGLTTAWSDAQQQVEATLSAPVILDSVLVQAILTDIPNANSFSVNLIYEDGTTNIPGSRETYVGTFPAAPYTWNVKTGDVLEIYDVFTDVYVADARSGVTISAVYSRVGDDYVLIPPAYYTVDQAYYYHGEIVTAVIFPLPLTSHIAINWSDDILAVVDTGVYNSSNMIGTLASYLGCSTSYTNTWIESYPNFTIYGYTDILEILTEIVEQSLGSWMLDNTTVKLTYLATKPSNVVATLNADNIGDFKIRSTDVMSLYNNTTFTWPWLSKTGGKAFVNLAVPEESLVSYSSKDITVFQDQAQALNFARFWIHRMSRDWLYMDVDGFVDSAKLEPNDPVAINIEGFQHWGEVQTCTYDHLTGTTSLTILISYDTANTGVSLWDSGNDVVISFPSIAFGYNVVNNTNLVRYFDGNGN